MRRLIICGEAADCVDHFKSGFAQSRAQAGFKAAKRIIGLLVGGMMIFIGSENPR
ncbi:hypothetical protein [Sphingopyxis sp.]|jgi:hypothetical protein|uniref:hypothetical protein n=1 Tax=Sphingomonadales TaxID=204457 RepID=UPI003F7016CA